MVTSEAQVLWDKIRNPNCTMCDLHKEAQTVCLIGDGPVPAKIMVIGEAPGFREDDIGRPFSGASGRLLDQVLEANGLSREMCFITNVAKCRPPENRTPTKTEIKTCRPYLDQEIEEVRPEFILLLGNSALGVVKKSGITKYRGGAMKFGDATAFATFHPAAILRNPRYDQAFRADMAAFARLVRGEAGATPPKTFLVKDKGGLVACTKAIMAAEAVAYDLETTGTEEYRDDARVVTIGIAVREDLAFVVPIHHPESPWNHPDKVLRIVGNALLYTNAKRVAHNAKFDDRWLNRFGVPINADFDTMIAAHILDENRFKGLKPLAQILLGVDKWEIDLKGGAATSTPLVTLAKYNARDAAYTLRLYYRFRQELRTTGNERLLRLFVKLMMPASKALTSIERKGLWVDRKRLAERRIEAQQKLAEINAQLVETFGYEANWNSPKILAELLFEKLELPMVDMTKGGAPSTRESVLLRLKDQHPVAELILEWRKWSKYDSTYLRGWSEIMDDEGRLHANYKLTGTVTGRLSSGKLEDSRGPGLNVQQVPRDIFIRSIIGAPDGWRFVEADFSQVELRIAAHYSKDRTLQRLYQLGEDVHLTTAVQVTGKPAGQITKEERKKAKAVNFGFLYGMGARKFVDYARDSYGVSVSQDEADLVRRRFFQTFDGLPAWHSRQRRLVRQYGRVQSAIGRVRHLPDIESSDKEVKGEAERQAINSPVQSLASDMMLMALISLNDEMDPREACIVGTVHDSIMFEIKDEVVDVWVKRITEVMEHLPLKQKFGVELSVPLKVDVKVSSHWGE